MFERHYGNVTVQSVVAQLGLLRFRLISRSHVTLPRLAQYSLTRYTLVYKINNTLVKAFPMFMAFRVKIWDTNHLTVFVSSMTHLVILLIQFGRVVAESG